MPGVPAPVSDERDGLRTFVAQQHQVLRIAAHGLTDDQARRAASVSSLTIGGLLKHVTTMEATWMSRVAAAPGPWEFDLRPMEERRAAFVDDFTMRADETLASVLAGYDDRCRRTEEAIPALDLDTPVPVPPRRGSPRARRPGRCAGCCCTWSRRSPATPAMPTSSGRASTAPPRSR